LFERGWGLESYVFHCRPPHSHSISPLSLSLSLSLSPLPPQALAAGGVAAVLALDQVGRSSKLFVHAATATSTAASGSSSSSSGSGSVSDKSNSLTAALLAAPIDAAGASVAMATSTSSSSSATLTLPPTSLTSFLNAFAVTAAASTPGAWPVLCGAVLAGYDGAFDDPLYHSTWDDSTATAGSASGTLSAANVASAATVVARALYSLALSGITTTSTESGEGDEQVSGGGSGAVDSSGVAADAALVAELLGCLTGSEGAGCALLAPYSSTEAATVARQASSPSSSSSSTATAVEEAAAAAAAAKAPLSFYPGVLSSATGLPLVQRADGTVAAKWTGAFDYSAGGAVNC